MTQYCAVRFERGMGLGNRLYPWARCHLHSLRHDMPMLAPRWWWPPRVRPLLKTPPPARELAGHLYLRGLRVLPEYISGARRALIETTSRRDVLFFRGEADRLAGLRGNEHELLRALHRINSLPLPPGGPYVGLHVRRGDFNRRARTPLAWFIAALRAVRAAIGRDVPARVVSDAGRAELRELLLEPGVELARTHTPLADLLVLAEARVLLASGSSFSAWAAFLGSAPAVTQPEHSLAWFGVEARSFLGHFDPAADNGTFLHAAAAAF